MLLLQQLLLRVLPEVMQVQLLLKGIMLNDIMIMQVAITLMQIIGLINILRLDLKQIRLILIEVMPIHNLVMLNHMLVLHLHRLVMLKMP